MLCYTYDGSFNGLLTTIHEIYYRRQKPQEIVPAGSFNRQLFVRQEHIACDEDKAARVYDAIDSKISSRALGNAYCAYLSEHPRVGMWIYEYLRLGWKLGPGVDLRLAEERVHRVHKLAGKVKTEQHRLLGLVRFQLYQGDIYYAALEPDHNVLELLAPHFASRLSDQNWIIHDLRRDLAVVFNRKEWVATGFTLKQKLELEQDEQYYQRLWRQYYDSIAISTRKNPRLQKQCMPERYWKHLVEKNGRG